MGFALMAQNIYANDVGVMGETYAIIEMDFLDFIRSRIATMQQNGQWQSLQNRVQQDAVHYRDRPKPVTTLTRATETKTWKFDPSIVLDHDITTPEGRLIAPAGTRVNPLMTLSLSKALIFYNGDDDDQIKWALEQDKKLKGHDKLILVNGSVLDQERQFKKSVYFDQAGTLTIRFGIKHVPALIVQEGQRLKIMEISL